MKMRLFARAVLALLVAGYGIGAAQGGQSAEIKADDMVRGKADAPVTIIEYASMTCPHCAAFAKTVVPELTKNYVDTGKVKFVFREFPLDGAARMASALARCFSGEQYFSFINLLFANQMEWIKDFDGNGMLSREDILEGLSRMASRAGMPREKAAACISDEKNLAIVDAHWMEAQTRYKMSATPTFIINGTPHVGEISYDELKKIIDPLVGR